MGGQGLHALYLYLLHILNLWSAFETISPSCLPQWDHMQSNGFICPAPRSRSYGGQKSHVQNSDQLQGRGHRWSEVKDHMLRILSAPYLLKLSDSENIFSVTSPLGRSDISYTEFMYLILFYLLALWGIFNKQCLCPFLLQT